MKLIGKVVNESQLAIDFLEQRLELNLSQIAILGGHSYPRTHRPWEGMVGSTLINALQQKLRVYEAQEALLVVKEARASKLLQMNGAVTGVRVIRLDSQTSTDLFGQAVVLASGGFAANKRMLLKYRPDLYNLPTTAGSFSTGDGIDLAVSMGASLIDMDKVQVHPTAWIDPSDPENGSKILAAELLRGVGGILMLRNGTRFCNELSTRKDISDRMLSTRSSDSQLAFPLILSSSAAAAADEHVGMYLALGLLQRFEGLAALAHGKLFKNGAYDAVLATLRDYGASARAGVDEFGKGLFRNAPDTATDLDKEVFYAGLVTPR
jgi:succinate dehydrogenase/fumarate reductase flavoprotein subunit